MTKSQQSTLNIGEARSQKQELLTHVTLVMNDFLALRFELYSSDKVWSFQILSKYLCVLIEIFSL